jgi:xanthine dehydrogenase accessory factor
VEHADLYRTLLELAASQTPCATATIVRAKGSVPNGIGAKMLVRTGGELVTGTVGGGTIEHTVIREARAAIAEGASRLVTAKLTQKEAGGIGMMCGGQVEVFIEVHLPLPRLVLCGAGHINKELARLARELDYRLTIIDDRPEWANPTHYPGLDVRVALPEEELPRLELGPRDFVIIGTRTRDLDALEAAVRTPARYVGLVASERKSVLITKELGQRLDLGPVLPRLHAPVGLDLGGRSPQAVALSILAEVQSVRHGKTGAPMRVVEERLRCLTEHESRD